MNNFTNPILFYRPSLFQPFPSLNLHFHLCLETFSLKKSIKKYQKLKGSHLQTNVESQISAMVYLDLILRSVTDPGLLKIMIKFLLDEEKFDEQRIIDVLIERINSPDSRVSLKHLLVSLSHCSSSTALYGDIGLVRHTDGPS